MRQEKHNHDGRRDEECSPCAHVGIEGPAQIAGQVQAVERMVDTDRYCVDLMHQLAAVQAAIVKVGEMVLRSHVQTWLNDGIRNGDRAGHPKVDQLVAVFGRYRRIRDR